MDIPDDLAQAVQAAQWDLLMLPGVTSVSIGLREENGEALDELAVRIGIRDASQQPGGLPEQLAGVPICVIENPIEPCGFPDDNRYKELLGGIEITNPALGHGTLGALVEDTSTGAILGLTCYHVVGNPGQTFPDHIWQPTNPPLFGTSIPDDDKISESWCVDFPQSPLPLSLPQPLMASVSDSAAIDLGAATQRSRTFSRAVAGNLAPPNLADAVTTTAAPSLGDKVRARGFVSGPRTGIVVGLHQLPLWNVGAQFAVLLEQIEILAWPPGSSFAQKGDSGALVLAETDPTAVGLLWGATPDGMHASASEIGRVENALGVSTVWA